MPENPNVSQEAGKDQSAAAPTGKAAAAEQRAPTRAGVVTNPVPPVDPDAPPVVAKVDENSLPQATLDEMEAGRAALNRNRPVASAMEAGRAAQASESNSLKRA